jgi:hypothetical protein
MSTVTGGLRTERELPGLGGATAWLNSEPLTPAGLRGKVVLVQFCTYSCVNWLRTLPYVRAWHERYGHDGLVVIGAHSPEFPFEHEIERVRPALEAMGVEYPIAMDNDFAIWRAFGNQYWPALYLADAQGQIRYHHFGEGGYDASEQAIQQLLGGTADGTAPVETRGIEAGADIHTLRSPETYVGYERGERFASPERVRPDDAEAYSDAPRLRLNEWSLSGNWTFGEQATAVNEAGGRLSYRFHARDVNLVLGPAAAGEPVRFRVLVDGVPPGEDGGLDVDEDGAGTIAEARLYQLVRQRGRVSDRTFEITFLDPGAQAYVFTFG